GEHGVEKLHHHRAADADALAAIHDPHAALGERRRDLVAALKDLARARVLSHGSSFRGDSVAEEVGARLIPRRGSHSLRRVSDRDRERPKKSWREIDAQRDGTRRSSPRPEDARSTASADRASKQY